MSWLHLAGTMTGGALGYLFLCALFGAPGRRVSVHDAFVNRYHANVNEALLRQQLNALSRRIDIAATMHHASQGEGCPICKTEDRCRTRAVLEGE